MAAFSPVLNNSNTFGEAQARVQEVLEATPKGWHWTQGGIDALAQAPRANLSPEARELLFFTEWLRLAVDPRVPSWLRLAVDPSASVPSAEALATAFEQAAESAAANATVLEQYANYRAGDVALVARLKQDVFAPLKGSWMFVSAAQEAPIVACEFSVDAPEKKRAHGSIVPMPLNRLAISSAWVAEARVITNQNHPFPPRHIIRIRGPVDVTVPADSKVRATGQLLFFQHWSKQPWFLFEHSTGSCWPERGMTLERLPTDWLLDLRKLLSKLTRPYAGAPFLERERGEALDDFQASIDSVIAGRPQQPDIKQPDIDAIIARISSDNGLVAQIPKALLEALAKRGTG